MKLKLLILFALVFPTFTLQAQVPFYVPSANLVGHWPLGFSLSNWAQNAYHGTSSLYSAEVGRLGVVGDAILPVTDGYLRFDDLPVNTGGQFTINLWLNLRNFSSDKVLLDLHPDTACGNYLQISLHQDSLFITKCANQPSFKVSIGHKSSFTNLWNMVTIQVSSDTTMLYINGLLKTRFATSWAGSTTANLILGNCYNTSSKYSMASASILDDISVWSRNLSPCELAQIYNEDTAFRIISQPVDQSSTIGGIATFSITTSHAAGYQWESNIGPAGSFIPLSDNGQYSGVHTSVLTVSSISATNANQRFRCRVDFATGCATNSNEVKVSVNTTSVNYLTGNTSYLHQNIPNPSNGATTVRYRVTNARGSSIVIHDVTGRKVFSNLITTSGDGELTISKTKLSSGTYYYSLLENGLRVDTKKMVVN